jgi:S-adenosylmethionine:tRNA ribosyltransferase-isomerase
MKLADYAYELPPELIAQAPLASRAESRLLRVAADSDAFREYRFDQLGELLGAGDLLVMNDTRVIPGRLFGRKQTGGQVEMLLERILEPTLALVQLRSNRSPVVGSELIFEPDIHARVDARDGRFFRLRFEGDVAPLLDAPTAGLHFDSELLAALARQGIAQTTITLHVGAGTFLPLDADQLASGRLHSEELEVSADACAAVEAARKGGGRVIAVGTTSVRALESAASSGRLRPYRGETDIFIRPGYRFRVVDAMITNFHLPESSLLMLVAAFCGRDTILAAYHYAIEQRFRFYSYGDAMFVERRDNPDA